MLEFKLILNECHHHHPASDCVLYFPRLSHGIAWLERIPEYGQDTLSLLDREFSVFSFQYT